MSGFITETGDIIINTAQGKAFITDEGTIVLETAAPITGGLGTSAPVNVSKARRGFIVRHGKVLR